MKRFAVIICIASSIVLRCSLGGSSDLSGGGVIGNPYSSTFSYTDTIHCKVVTKNNGLYDLGAGTLSPFKPFGPDSARVNQKQSYSYQGTQGEKRFRFSSCSGEHISSWTFDSTIEWTWTTVGTCSVFVQSVGTTDTSKWSTPLIVHIVE
jgi:hypothetical protein